jgi:tetratricopeptide (TPR) repeat protein
LFDKTILDRSLAAYQKSLALRPDDAYTPFQMGVIHSSRGTWNEALAQFREAVRLDPNLMEAHDNLVVALRLAHGEEFLLGNKTIAACKDAVRKSPGDADASFYLGVAYLAYLQERMDQEAIASLRASLKCKQDPVTRQYLAWALCIQTADLAERGKLAEAITTCREATQHHPTWDKAHIQLGLLLMEHHRPDEGFAELTEALRHPLSTSTSRGDRHGISGRLPDHTLDQAKVIIALRDAVRTNPGLGSKIGDFMSTADQRWLQEHVAFWRDRLSHDPGNADTHFHCSEGLYRFKGAQDQALAAVREGIRLRPADPAGYFQMGRVYTQMGRYEDAVLAFQRGESWLIRHQPALHAGRAVAAGATPLGANPFGVGITLLANGTYLDSDRFSSAGWVKDAQRLERQERKLLAVLAGKERPADAAERIEYARMCEAKQRYRDALRFYAEAFAERPELADNPNPQHRYNAACAAALAGCGGGKDALLFECAERAGWRKQALGWLRSDLAAWQRRLDAGQAPGRAAAVRALRHWQRDSDLAGVRGPEAIAGLPADEREAWTTLWAEVAARANKAQEKRK